jgi:hypothetical protein
MGVFNAESGQIIAALTRVALKARAPGLLQAIGPINGS